MRSKINLNRNIVLLTYKKCGRSLRATGKALNVSDKVIKRHFKEWGIEYDMPPRYSFDHTVFDNLNEQSLYWLGFIAADGNVYKHNYSYTLKLELATKDEQHLLKFKKFMKSDAPILNYVNNNNRKNIKFKKDTYYSSQIRIISKYLFDKLTEFNIVPNKTNIYSMPHGLIDHPLLRHFIRGLIDADGCYNYRYNNKSPTITGVRISFVGNPSFVTEIFNLIRSKCDVDTGSLFADKKQGCGKFEFEAKDDVIKIVKYLYNDASTYLERKANIALDALKFINMNKVLDFARAQQIREEYKTIKSSIKLAEKYNVSKPTILRILRNETYTK